LAGLDDAPAQRLGESVVRARYASVHGRSAYGERADLEALTPDALRGDARERLGPAGAVLALAGGGDPERLVDAAARAFDGWTGSTRPHPKPEVHPAHRAHVDGPGAQTQIGVTDDAVAPGAAGWTEQALAMAVLSGAMGSRLPTEVRERRGLVYTVSSSVRSVRGDAYRFTYASTTPERAAETLEVVLRELDRWRAGVDGEELERARTLLRSNLVMQAESSGGRASRLASDVEAFGRPRPLREVEAALAGTGLDAVNAFLTARPTLRPTVVTSGPVPRAWEAVA
jgi:predicted Zn-dependent peptidase